MAPARPMVSQFRVKLRGQNASLAPFSAPGGAALAPLSSSRPRIGTSALEPGTAGPVLLTMATIRLSAALSFCRVLVGPPSVNGGVPATAA
jgi:hypothetical protein